MSTNMRWLTRHFNDRLTLRTLWNRPFDKGRGGNRPLKRRGFGRRKVPRQSRHHATTRRRKHVPSTECTVRARKYATDSAPRPQVSPTSREDEVKRCPGKRTRSRVGGHPLDTRPTEDIDGGHRRVQEDTSRTFGDISRTKGLQNSQKGHIKDNVPLYIHYGFRASNFGFGLWVGG